MYLRLRNLIGFAVLAAAAIASWYWGSVGVSLDTAADAEPGGPLGYYLRDADISILDEAGSILYEISAAAVEERPAENRTLLSRVLVKYSPLADVPWQVRAESGEIPSDQTYIELSGAVELASTGAAGREPTTIQAPKLRFAPEEYLATTDTEVSVLLGAKRLEAVGMRADLRGDYLELESTVHGLFNP